MWTLKDALEKGELKFQAGESYGMAVVLHEI
jgi:hypothetical protein